MEPRKIFRSGKGSYILTLPKEWVEQQGLREGDILYIDVKGGSLHVLAREKRSREVSIDLSDLDFNRTLRRIIACYLAGTDVIRVKIGSDEQRRAVALAADMLVGMEIIEDIGNEVELLVQVDPSKLRVEDVSEKMRRICVSMLEDMIRVFREYDKAMIGSIVFREHEVDRLCFLILRLTDSTSYRTFARSIERIADHIEIIADSIMKLERCYEELAVAESVLDAFKLSTMAFLKRDLTMAEEALDKIAEVEEEVSKVQRRILSYEKEEIVHLKTIFDSLNRILAYSSDIAETAINSIIEVSVGKS